jgi:hypothetical protein
MNTGTGHTRMTSARIVTLGLFQIGEDIYAHWTPEDREILKGEGANQMVWMDELAVHERDHKSDEEVSRG